VSDVPWGGAFNPALTTMSLDDVDHVVPPVPGSVVDILTGKER
jgi:hypothetical protein